MLHFSKTNSIETSYTGFTYSPFRVHYEGGEVGQVLFFNSTGYLVIRAFKGKRFMGYVTDNGFSYDPLEAKRLESAEELYLDDGRLDYYHYEVVDISFDLLSKEEQLIHQENTKRDLLRKLESQVTIDFNQLVKYKIDNRVAPRLSMGYAPYIYNKQEADLALGGLRYCFR